MFAAGELSPIWCGEGYEKPRGYHLPMPVASHRSVPSGASHFCMDCSGCGAFLKDIPSMCLSDHRLAKLFLRLYDPPPRGKQSCFKPEKRLAGQ